MNLVPGSDRTRSTRRLPRSIPLGVLLAAITLSALAVPHDAAAAEAPVDLGTAGSFSVLAGSTVTNTGPSLLSAGLGVSPGSAITGFPPGLVLGAVHAANGVAGTAKADALVAFNDIDGRTSPAMVPDDLVGLTLPAGLHASAGPMALTGQVTLDAAGDPDAVFLFRSPSTLITGTAAEVTLTNGAQACNVFWQVDSSATLGTGTAFQGTVLAAGSITLTTGATLRGRAHALNGAVTLDSNTLTSADCATAPSTSSGAVTPGGPSGTAAPSTTTTSPDLPGTSASTTDPVAGTVPSDSSGTAADGSTTGPSGGPDASTPPGSSDTALTTGGLDLTSGPGADSDSGRTAGRGAELSATGPGDLALHITLGVLILATGLLLSRCAVHRTPRG